MPIFSLNVNQSAPVAKVLAEKRGCSLLRIHHDSDTLSTLIVECASSVPIYNWFHTRSSALLHFRELEGDEAAAEQRGMKLDFDDDDEGGLSGLEALEGGNYSVSTLTPGLHGKPSYRYFNELRDAVTYARERARRGPGIKVGGKAYFILGHNGVLYRVFRGVQVEEQRGTAEKLRREIILVQKNTGTVALPTGQERTRWVLDKTLSVEIDDPGLLENRRRIPAQYPHTQTRKNLPPRGGRQ